MGVTRRRAAFSGAVAILALVLAPGPAAADDDAHAGGHDPHHHHLAVAGGAAFKAEKPKSAWFLGVDYEYRFNPKIGLGGYYEETLGDFNLQALGIMLFFHPTESLKLAAGGGVERKLGGGHDKALIRFQVAYDFHAGQVTYGPMAAWDLIEDQSNVVYVGFGVGFGF